jgi:aspartyl-tRNA synthetase
MTWEEAMWTYGNDKPDIRFGMKIGNLKFPRILSFQNSAFAGTLIGVGASGFSVFDNAETVFAIAVPGCSEYTRKQVDELTEWVKRPQIGMQGMVYIKCNADGTYKSSVDKFFTEDKLKAIADAADAQSRRPCAGIGRPRRKNP